MREALQWKQGDGNYNIRFLQECEAYYVEIGNPRKASKRVERFALKLHSCLYFRQIEGKNPDNNVSNRGQN